jgi:hypothetical protein
MAAPDVHERLRRARWLLHDGDLAVVTLEYLWLWSHMLEHDESLLGVRSSFFVVEAARLCARHPPAHAAFVALREAIPVPPRAEGPARSQLDDWLDLHRITDAVQPVLAWLSASRHPLDPRVAGLLEPLLVDRLVEAERWSDLAELYPAPLARFARQTDFSRRARSLGVPNADPETVAVQQAYAAEEPRRIAYLLVRSLRAAGRLEEAKAAAEAALAWEDTPPMRAVIEASTAGRSHPDSPRPRARALAPPPSTDPV